MSELRPLDFGEAPRLGSLYGFSVVQRDGQSILAGSHDQSLEACSWNLSSDVWTVHELDDPWLDEANYTELTAFGAVVVDGRIVGGGGGDHQGFALWDLESGKVRLSAQEGGGVTTSAVVVGGRALFVVGSPAAPGVQVWDASVVEADEEEYERAETAGLDKPPSPYASMVDVNELEARSHAASAVAAGALDGRLVLVANGADGGVLVWDVDGQRALVEFDDLDEGLTDFALVTGDRAHVVAAGGQQLVVGDPATGEWGEPLAVPGDEISCLAAGLVNGRLVAVTGSEDGTVCAWNLDERWLLAEPIRGMGEVRAISITELDGRQVFVSTGRDGVMRVWEFTL
ncbi:hypothetical protein GCM10009678_91880 [Actinomadura kijaniata]|uniref:WD40 repeat protein n=1 Tax=Actinomadura namibiensis TaxID=182080 RepID=A0A7W3LT19_ACTNM|nr:WD40 repeat domain-containing protein [Actinomadura namibiensis]MBA8953791.1 WD40 repeat protein [Actinomadura namibiensis]